MITPNAVLNVGALSPTRLKELAEWCNLKVVGTRGVWWVRKSATSPVTRKEYFFKRSTKTTDLRTAVARALPWVEDFLARVGDPSGPQAAAEGGIVTLGALFKAYLAAPTVEAKAAVRKTNLGALRRMIQLVHGATFAIEEASALIISKQLVKDYQTKRLEAGRVVCGEDLAQLEAVKRGINSALKQAQSIFSKEALDDYGRLHLPPGVLEFARAMPVPARKQGKPVQLPDDAVERMRVAIGEQKEKDVTLWAAFQLMVWSGIRSCEAAHARVGWLEELEVGYRLQLVADGDFIPKGNDTSRVMPKLIVEELLAAVVVAPGEDRALAHLVPAKNKTDRHEAIYRRLNDWLRLQGVSQKANKVAGRLRKYFFDKVKQQQGLMLALAASGHSSLSTLTTHYTEQPQMAQPIKLGA